MTTPTRQPVEAAESILRELGGFAVDDRRVPPVAELLSAVERFASVEFDVPAHPEADSLLFQYATTYDASAFVVSLVRQLEVEDEDGEHECFVHLRCEYRYPVDADVQAAADHARWWNRSYPEPLVTWLGQVEADPIWRTLAGKTPTAFVIRQGIV